MISVRTGYLIILAFLLCNPLSILNILILYNANIISYINLLGCVIFGYVLKDFINLKGTNK